MAKNGNATSLVGEDILVIPTAASFYLGGGVTEFPLGPNETERLRVLQASGLMDALAVAGLDVLCEEAARHFSVKTAIVTLLDKDVQVFKAKFGIEANSTPRRMAFCNFTILSDQVFIVGDALADQRFASNPLVTGPPFIRFYAGAPLIFRQEVRLGALCLLHPKPRTFSLGDRAELHEMADRVTDFVSDAWYAIDHHQ
ncbi:GAF domain-containing protein [Pararhizobium antarcticum]|uniref:GAF domain-containing protein n=1 Tax=Pararhizobium antarcticum TaxID=1798805 RepID=A0A657LQR8_9HYPH|nr:GAF domain-containing protein [Pararhizobium antarcticum]OJF93669.1 hypothetical protein AX760_21580 [Pararhizobium antarcticum]